MGVLATVAGIAIVSAVLLSAVKTVILPRNAQTLITRGLFRTVFIVLKRVAHLSPSAYQESVLALIAPIALVTLPVVWVFFILNGFALIYWGTGDMVFTEAIAISGSSITTLGFVPASGQLHLALAFSEAIIGLIIIALLITFLPSLYTAFVKREIRVAKLEVRAGDPPTALVFLLRQNAIGWLDDLDPYWLAWEQWFAEIEESHTTFPMLTLFRSPDPNRSWITAAGTVLDAAAITQAALPDHRSGAGAVTIRAGFTALRNIADIYHVDYDPDPDPTDPIAVTRAEFDEVLASLADAGIPVIEDEDEAWAAYAGWRVNYDAVLLALAQFTAAPVAPWVSDRSSPGYQARSLMSRRRR